MKNNIKKKATESNKSYKLLKRISLMLCKRVHYKIISTTK